MTVSPAAGSAPTLVEPEEESSFYKWFLVWVLFVVGALNYADRVVLTAMFPLLKADLGMTDLGMAGIGTVFLWSYALASPFAGVIGDKKSRRLLVIGCLSAWSLVMVATSFVTSDSQLLSTRFFLGLAEALYFPVCVALVSQFHDFRTRAFAIAVQSAGMGVGAISGGAYGGYVGVAFGWRTAVLTLGVFGLVLAVVCWFVIRKDRPAAVPAASQTSPGGGGGFMQSIRSVVTVPLCLIMIAQAMLISVGTWIFMNWLPLYFSQVFHLGLGSAGVAGNASLSVGAICGVLIGGWLSDRVARKSVARRLLMQALLYAGSVPFLFLFMASNDFNYVAFSIFGFVVIRSLGSANEVPILCDSLPLTSRSTAMGLLNFANCICGGLGILASGFLKAHIGLKTIFFLSSMLVVLAALLVFAGYRLALRTPAKATELNS